MFKLQSMATAADSAGPVARSRRSVGRQLLLGVLGPAIMALSILLGATAANAATSASITASTVGRDASTGNFTWDVTAKVSNYWAANGSGTCVSNTGSGCKLDLVATLVTGADVILESHSGLYGKTSPDTEHYVGSKLLTKVQSIHVELKGAGDPFVTTAKNVTDPYPVAKASLKVNSVGRDASSDNFTWDVTATASNYQLPDGVCGDATGSECEMALIATLTDGSTNEIDTATDLLGQSYPYTHHFVGNVLLLKVASLKVQVRRHDQGAYDSSVVAVTDTLPTASISLKVNAIAASHRNSETGNRVPWLAWDVSISASHYLVNPTKCALGSCGFQLNIRQRDPDSGQITEGEISIGDFPEKASSATVRIQDAAQLGDVVALEGWVSSGNTTDGYILSTGWVPVRVRPSAERSGGPNPAENACACQYVDPVDSSTGALWETTTDLDLGGVGPSLNFTRTYSSSQDAASDEFGSGWSDNFNMHLDPLSSTFARVVQENGSAVNFSKSGSVWVPDSGVLAKLTTTGSGATQTWTYTRRGTAVFTFNSNGQLTKIADLHSNTVVLARDSDGRVLTATASGGRKLTFTRDGGRIVGVADSAGRAVSYEYDDQGNLASITGADGGVTHYAYTNGLLSGVTRPGGSTTTTTYDSNYRVATQTDGLQRTTTFAYGDFNTTVTDPTGVKTVDSYSGGLPVKRVLDADGAHPRTSSTTYDGAGNQVSATDAQGKTTSFTYDAAGNVLTKTDPLHHTTTYTYNSLNKVLTVQDARGKTSSATYNTAGDQLTSTSRGGVQQSWTLNSNGTPATWVDGRGKTTSYGYNSAGLQTSVSDPDGHVNSATYSTAGFVASRTSGVNKTTTYTRDALGRELTATTPGNHTTTTTYTADGEVATVTDARGKTTTNQYDAAGQLTSTTDPLNHTTHYTYDTAGRPATTTDANGKTTTQAYDAFGALTAVTDADNRTTHYSYNATGGRTSTTLPSGAQSTATYDDGGQLASSTDAKGKTTAYSRDADGQVTSTTDPLNRVTGQTWTDDGQEAVTTQPDTSTVQQAYNAAGALSSYTNPDGLVTSYTYDDAGLPASRTEPGTKVTSYTYDSAGRLKTTSTPDGHVTTLSYDDDSNVVTSHSDLAGSTDVTYSYNANGQRAAMNDATGGSTYAYDSAGQLTGTSNGANIAVGYAYTATGNVSKITYPGNKDVSYQYDDAGQMTSLTDWGNRTTLFTWTQDGQQHAQNTPNGVSQTWTYDADGQPTDDLIAASSTLADYGYTWNDAGELTADSSTDPLGSNVTHQYTYDGLSQLASVQGAGPSGPITATPGGQLTKTADATTYAYNAAQQVTSSTPTTGPATSYTYDGNGSRISSTVAATGATPAAATSYTYDRDGNLASATLPGGTTISYAADGDGLRQSRTQGSSSRSFLWNTENDLPLLLDDGDHSYLYGPGDTPIAQIDDGSASIQYLSGDLLGSTRVITDSAGVVVGTYRYSTFGSDEAHIGAVSALGYTGAWTDPDTSLIYLRARDYDPITGQFVQVDPAIEATSQPFAYAMNSPLTISDPSGLKGVPHIGPRGNGESAAQQWDEAAAFLNQFNPVHWVWSGFENEVQSSNAGCAYLGSVAYGVNGVVSAAAVVPGVGLAASEARAGASIVGAAVSAASAGSRLSAASSAAFKAAEEVGAFTVSAKHLPNAAGRYAKWASGVDINGAIADALRSRNATFLPNMGATDRFIVQTDLGVPVGLRGETTVKVVVSNNGKIITAYPKR